MIVAAGIYNNLLRDVNLSGTISQRLPNNLDTNEPPDATYCGSLVGRIYAGSWVYNNLIAGGSVPTDFWGQVCNSNLPISLNSGCVGHDLGMLDDYYFNNGSYRGSTGCTLAKTRINGETYYYCGNLQHQADLVQLASEYSSAANMAKYNYHFETWYSNDANDYTDYTNFRGNTLGLMSSMKCDNENNIYGSFYTMASLILQYELGLTVNEKDTVTGSDLTRDEQLLAAVYQFRRWQTDEDNHNAPILGDYYGTPCKLTFITNHQIGLKSDAYFANRYTEKSIQRIFQQTMVKPSEDPTCEGYEFVGWKMKLDSIDQIIANNDYYNSYADVKKSDYPDDEKIQAHLNDDGTYDFEHPGNIAEDAYTFVAVWQINTYTVYYKIEDENGNWVSFDKPSSEQVDFGGTIIGVKESDQPASRSGYVFVGWYLEADLPQDGEDADINKKWRFGQTGYKMPAYDIELFAGWLDNFNMLRTLLNDETYVDYNSHYLIYFNDVSGQNYHNAYVAANTAKETNDTSDVDALLGNLETYFKALRVDPEKLLTLAAFDETLIQNTCPFLYDAAYYTSYETFKKRMKDDYIYRTDEDILTNINGYINNYETMNRLFEGLNDNLRNSVIRAGGVESTTITALVEKYQELEERYNALLSESEKYDMSTLEAAKSLANQYWSEINKDLDLRDVQFAVTNYENALNNLKVKTVDNNDSNGNNQSNSSDKAASNSANQISKLGVSPVILSIIAVSVLAAGVIGFIGVDVLLNKRRVGKVKTEGAKNEKSSTVPDEDTYI